MSWEYAIYFGAVSFSIIIGINIKRAYLKKEKAHYITRLISGFILLGMITILIGQFILFAVFFFAAVILSVVALPKVKETLLREAVTS